MKGDKDTKYMVRHTMYFSDGTETTVECHKNPNAEEISAKVAEAQAEISEEVGQPESGLSEQEVENQGDVSPEVPKIKRAYRKRK